MPDFTSMPAGGPDGALSWYNRALATVLGLNPADPTLPADLLSELATDAQRKALGTVIGRRFQRRFDPITGMATIAQVGGPLVLVEAGEDADPVLARVAATYLGAARAAIGTIDTSQCIPGKCADEIAGIIRQAEALIDTIIAEAPSRRNRFQMFLHLDELTDRTFGLIGRLGQLFKSSGGADPNTIGWERANESIAIATGALDCFEKAIGEVRGLGDEPSLAETAEIIRGCGAHVSIHARNVRAALRGAGIGTCELSAVPLTLITVLSSQDFKSVSLDEALQALESEPERWATLIAGGQAADFINVRRSAETLHNMLSEIDTETILKSLGILSSSKTQSEPREAFALSLSFQMDRLWGYALSVLNMILGNAPLDSLRSPERPREGDKQKK